MNADTILPDAAAFQATELIFYGRLGLTGEGDRFLAEHNYGRAHFRALYVIARTPGITTNGLLAKLKITNQSLSRVMGPLVRDAMVVQGMDAADRRQRQHRLTAAGAALEESVRRAQFRAFEHAAEVAGPDAMRGFLRILFELVPEADRQLLTHQPAW